MIIDGTYELLCYIDECVVSVFVITVVYCIQQRDTLSTAVLHCHAVDSLLSSLFTQHYMWSETSNGGTCCTRSLYKIDNFPIQEVFKDQFSGLTQQDLQICRKLCRIKIISSVQYLQVPQDHIYSPHKENTLIYTSLSHSLKSITTSS